MQLLYIANRFEFRPQIQQWLDDGPMVVCDRYLASSIAYGEAQGSMRRGWPRSSDCLPQPSLTLLLDIPPEASLKRKQLARDKFERDLPLLGACARATFARPRDAGWVHLDGARDKDAVTAAVLSAVRSRLGLL